MRDCPRSSACGSDQRVGKTCSAVSTSLQSLNTQYCWLSLPRHVLPSHTMLCSAVCPACSVVTEWPRVLLSPLVVCVCVPQCSASTTRGLSQSTNDLLPSPNAMLCHAALCHAVRRRAVQCCRRVGVCPSLPLAVWCTSTTWDPSCCR